VEAANDAEKRLNFLKKALDDTPSADPALATQTRDLLTKVKDIEKALSGDPVLQSHNEPTSPAVVDRVQTIITGHWTATSAATGTHQLNYEIASAEFAPVLEQLRQLIEVDLKALEDKAEIAGAPWTPGCVPKWSKE